MRRQKKLIEQAYQTGKAQGLAVWTQDEAGPFQRVPYPGGSWQPMGHPRRQPHEYLRAGTAKVLTLLHPTRGEARGKGVTHCTNAVLHPWLQGELTAILAALPEPAGGSTGEQQRVQWVAWQVGLTVRVSLPAGPPPLQMLLVLENLVGHKTPAFVVWLFAQGIMPLYTPCGGSWLNMTESVQRILTRRALHGQHPRSPNRLLTHGKQRRVAGTGIQRHLCGEHDGQHDGRGRGHDATRQEGQARGQRDRFADARR